MMNNQIRQQLFRFLEKVSQTADAKAMTARMLSGVLNSSARSLLPREYGADLPYSDLGRSEFALSTAYRSDIVFITGRFRSGSTLLWNIFRQVDHCTAYYEPFNERRWFDASARGQNMDATHRGVSNYWEEYEGLEELGQYFSDDWPKKELFMDAQSWDPAMKRYIEILAERAHGRPILQFNRIDFRLPWIRHHFPNAKIIHLYRHPRDEWYSCLFHDRCKNKECSVQEFFEHEGFYLRSWSQDLQYHFPFLNLKYIRHPYHLFYLLWRLSYLFGLEYAHHSLSYEQIMESPRKVLTELFEALDLQTYDLDGLMRLIDPRKAGRWEKYANESWFSEQEAFCESTLEAYLGKECQPVTPIVL